MANRIDLVRHPRKVGDEQGRYLGNHDTISERGQLEAKIVVERLAKIPHDLIVSSQIPRAFALARQYAERLDCGVTADALFNEIEKPQYLVGLARSDPVHARVMQLVRKHFDDGPRPRLSRGLRAEIKKRLGIIVPYEVPVRTREEVEEETRRAFSAFERYPADSVLVVTHAKRIASYVHWLTNGGTLRGFYQGTDRTLKVDTTGITTLIKEPDRRTHHPIWKIATVNDTAHFQHSATDYLESLITKLDSTPP